jgi:pilus assembly protein Flp/PilA
MHRVMTARQFCRFLGYDFARQDFLHDESGATAIEYALIAAGIAGAIVAVISTLGGSVTTMWTTISNAFG